MVQQLAGVSASDLKCAGVQVSKMFAAGYGVQQVFAAAGQDFLFMFSAVCACQAGLGPTAKEFSWLARTVAKQCVDHFNVQQLANIVWAFATSRQLNNPLLTVFWKVLFCGDVSESFLVLKKTKNPLG